MNVLKKQLKRVMRTFGFDIVAYRPFLELLGEWGIDTVLDVGANEGQFATELRANGFQGVIYSFEPTRKAFDTLVQKSASDTKWYTINCGLGRTDRSLNIDLATDSQLTSILAPLRPHSFSGQETIRLRRLDGWLNESNVNLTNACLKLDVQGYEREVLQGVVDLLPKFGAVITELALAKSYEGQPHLEDLASFLRDQGFDLWITRRGTWTPYGNREMECDGLFRNRAMTSADSQPQVTSPSL
jgi:FkbM family methyltransferase